MWVGTSKRGGTEQAFALGLVTVVGEPVGWVDGPKRAGKEPLPTDDVIPEYLNLPAGSLVQRMVQ